MHLIQITPGAGSMYCGNCFRDQALVAALRTLGHQALLVPLYLPLTLEEPDTGPALPIFFSGINVYLEQKAPFFRNAPDWLHQFLASPAVLRQTARFAAKTRPEQVGDLTVSMLRGEEGNQSRELEELIAWLKTQPPAGAICLSNGLLIGLARRLKAALAVPVLCMLQGEDSFLDALPQDCRAQAWATLAERAREVDACVAPSAYYAGRMTERLQLPKGHVRVVWNGINLAGFDRGRAAADRPPAPPVLGFFARMCREKGLDTLVEAFILLKRAGHVPDLKLKVGGGCGPGDEPFVATLRERLRACGLLGEAEFFPNLDRTQKVRFLESLTVLSVPALYGEAFGLYIIEALAAGVPVVQPRHAAFPELVAATGGGLVCEPGDPQALAATIEALLLNPQQLSALARAGQAAVHERFGAEAMAKGMLEVAGEFACRKPQT